MCEPYHPLLLLLLLLQQFFLLSQSQHLVVWTLHTAIQQATCPMCKLSFCRASMLTSYGVDRRSDPGDRDRMLFYLLIKKDGSTVLPAPDAAHPDFASSSLPSSGESTPQYAAAPAIIHQAPASSVPPAAEAAVQSISHQAVPTSLTSAAQVTTAYPDQPAVQPGADSLHPNPSLQQGLQQAAASEPGPHPSGHSTGLVHTSTGNPQAFAPPQISPPAALAPLSQSSWLPQRLLPQPTPASPQLQPTLPQLQPASPRLLPPSPQPAAAMPLRGQPSSQLTHQQMQGKVLPAAASQDISKEFLALLQETSTHLADSQPSWPNQTGSEPSIAQPQNADSRQTEAASSAVEAEGLRPGGTLTVSVAGTGPQVSSQSDEARAGNQGVFSSHILHVLTL